MTLEEVLVVVRQKIGQAIADIDGEPPLYSDDFLTQYLKTSNFELTILGVETEVTVDSDAVTITPDPSTVIGMLLAYTAAVAIISDDLVYRLKNGELGLAFTSGATSINTNQAAGVLRDFSKMLTSRRDLLLSAYLSGDPNAVLSRIT